MMFVQSMRFTARLLTLSILTVAVLSSIAVGQNPSLERGSVRREDTTNSIMHGESRVVLTAEPVTKETAVITQYFDPQGAAASDLVRRALAANAELVASRLDIERARARLRQAGLRPNPTIEVEQSTGRLIGSPSERATSIGFALPLELGGKRQNRIALAQAEFEVAEAEIANRERRLAVEVRTAYAEALAALRELEITEELNNIDLQTARIVEARVNEGESAALELNLLRVEVDRLRAQRALVEGKLQAALLKLKNITGMPLGESLRLREVLTTPPLPDPPASMEQAVEAALRTRADVRLARLNERAAQAGLRLARAEATPDVTVSTKYSFDRSLTDLPEPLVPVPDRTRLLSFGVSIEFPLFKRNQGAKAEASVAITQAQRRREVVEQLVRSEVASTYARYEASRSALAIFEQGVLGRSATNIRTMREAYRLGAFRITELLTEQRRLIDSQREYIEILTERYRALVDLHSAIGTPIQ